MSKELTTTVGVDLEALLIQGDLSKLSPEQRVTYYGEMCKSLGLNPLTMPFNYLVLNNKLQLYANKECTQQLRRINDVSITDLSITGDGITFETLVKAQLPNGRTDVDMGIVAIKGLAGNDLANAKLKSVTKGKRRVTLSICGLGFLDETEVETIADAKLVTVDAETGEVVEPVKVAAAPTNPYTQRPMEPDRLMVFLQSASKVIDQLEIDVGEDLDLAKVMGAYRKKYKEVPKHTKKDTGLLAGAMEWCLAQFVPDLATVEDTRHQMLFAMWGAESTTGLTPGQAEIMIRMCDYSKDDDTGEWTCNPAAVAELKGLWSLMSTVEKETIESANQAEEKFDTNPGDQDG
jgi:hypothetical protein